MRRLADRFGLLVLWCMFGLAAACGDEGATPLPPLESSQPSHFSNDHPRTTWIALTFSEAVDPTATESFELRCDDESQSLDADLVGERLVVVNPVGELPAGSICSLSWPSEDGDDGIIDFRIADGNDVAVVPYDRDDSTRITPSPDDMWLDSEGVLAIPAPNNSADGEAVFAAVNSIAEADGFSPLISLVVELPEAPLPDSLPLTTMASVAPMTTCALIDVDETSESVGERVPFFLSVRDDEDSDHSRAHHLLLFPAVRLRPLGVYALVLTRRAVTTPSSPLTPSPFMAAALGLTDAVTANEQRARGLLSPVLEVLEDVASPPIPAEDIALLLRFTIRSDEHFGDDLVSVYEQVQAMPAPDFEITSVDPDPETPGVAAIVHGTWTAPLWSDEDYFERDADGKPVPRGTVDLEFTLVLPDSACDGPVPLTMYQHGTPGSQEEAVWLSSQLRGGERDFAVAAFTDLNNREYDGGLFSPQIWSDIVDHGRFPDLVHNLAIADQISFVRLLQQLDTIDVLPIGAPDGKPEIDLSVPLTYVGISQGSNHGSGFLAYAPEIAAAALVVGGGSYGGTVLHQSESLWPGALELYPEVRRSEDYVGLQLLQQGADPQDPANQAVFVYADPHPEVAGSARASILMHEGLGDTMVPPWSTQRTAHTLGLPLLEPVFLPTPSLDVVSGEVSGNIGPSTTAALSQYVPFGYEGAPPTPSCEMYVETEGHFCAQIAGEAIAQRYAFLLSAIRDDVPTISTPAAARRESIGVEERRPIAVLRAAPGDLTEQPKRDSREPQRE